ncbi:MAG: hypothetical protein ACYDCK_07680 [Thermoplasmatota archaeon]
MDADEPGEFRIKLGFLLIWLGLLVAGISIASTLYASMVVTASPDEPLAGITLLMLPLAAAMIGAGLFMWVSAFELQRDSPRVEAQDEAPHGPRPGF